MQRSRGRTTAAVVAAVMLLAIPLVLTSCGRTAAEEIRYAVDGPLITYNTNTVLGAASGGSQAFARTLSGFGYHGPEGQVVADHDFGSVSVVGREPLVLDYQIADDAVYSDGKPVTCDDMLLAWASQAGRVPGFDAASRAGYADIAGVDCVAGQKKARVTFAPNRQFVDYMQLFSATTMMPSHVIADDLGVDVTGAIQTNDAPVLERIAQAWNTIWDLKPGLDMAHYPSSGPYKLEWIREDGAVVLVANDRWWGAQPITKRIVVYPRGVDIQDRINNGSLDVVDVAAGSSGALTIPDDYKRTDTPSAGIQQLIFAGQGPLAAPPARRALALCTPRDLIAGNAGVQISNARLNPVNDDAFGIAEDGAAAPPPPPPTADDQTGNQDTGQGSPPPPPPPGPQFVKADPDAARAALNNAPLTVRIGYQSPNARLSAAVGAIARACAPAGITVQEVASENTGPQTLKNVEIDVLLASTGGAVGSGSSGSSVVDAFTLHTGNGDNLPGYSNPQVDGIIDNLAVTSDPKDVARLLTDGSRALWGDMPTMPLYRQQRTLLVSNDMYAVSSNPTRWGAGWNMDRWVRSQ